MLINWSRYAHADILDILTYFASKEDRETGQAIVDKLFASTRRLESFPFSGKQGRIEGTRELVIRTIPYVLIYRIVSSDIVEIARIFHTSKSFPDSLAE